MKDMNCCCYLKKQDLQMEIFEIHKASILLLALNISFMISLKTSKVSDIFSVYPRDEDAVLSYL